MAGGGELILSCGSGNESIRGSLIEFKICLIQKDHGSYGKQGQRNKRPWISRVFYQYAMLRLFFGFAIWFGYFFAGVFCDRIFRWFVACIFCAVLLIHCVFLFYQVRVSFFAVEGTHPRYNFGIYLCSETEY